MISRSDTYQRMRKLIWVPVGVFASTLFLAYSYSVYLSNKRQLNQIQPAVVSNIQSQYGFFVSEIFLEQWDAVSSRLSELQGQTSVAFPNRPICFSLISTSEFSANTCTLKPHPPPVGKVGLVMGQKNLGTIEYFYDQSFDWLQLFSISFVLALLIAILITFFLIQLISNLMEKHVVEPLLSDVEFKSREAALGVIATQVAHDIRSPLAALQIVLTDVKNISEDRRELIKNAIDRIRHIASDLLLKNKSGKPGETSSKKNNEVLLSLVQSVVAEKSLQLAGTNKIKILLEHAPGTEKELVQVVGAELKRVLSNLINNSVEAINGTGAIRLSLRATREHVELVLEDNGKGIPPDIIPTLFQRGVSYDKADGSGLGLFHANEKMREWSGTLSLSSKIGKGSVVTLKWPRVKLSNG